MSHLTFCLNLLQLKEFLLQQPKTPYWPDRNAPFVMLYIPPAFWSKNTWPQHSVHPCRGSHSFQVVPEAINCFMKT